MLLHIFVYFVSQLCLINSESFAITKYYSVSHVICPDLLVIFYISTAFALAKGTRPDNLTFLTFLYIMSRHGTFAAEKSVLAATVSLATYEQVNAFRC